MDLRCQHMSEGPRWVDDANTDTPTRLDFESDRYNLRLGGARDVVGSDVIALVRCCVLLAHPVCDGSGTARSGGDQSLLQESTVYVDSVAGIARQSFPEPAPGVRDTVCCSAGAKRPRSCMPTTSTRTRRVAARRSRMAKCCVRGTTSRRPLGSRSTGSYGAWRSSELHTFRPATVGRSSVEQRSLRLAKLAPPRLAIGDRSLITRCNPADNDERTISVLPAQSAGSGG